MYVADGQSVDELALRRYWLGQLDEAGVAEIEDRYFVDTALFEKVEAIAEDLADDYVNGRLTGDERGRVHELAYGPEWKQRLEFASALRRQVADGSAPVRARDVSFWAGVRALFASQTLSFRLATAAASIVVAAGTATIVLQLRTVTGQVSTLRAQLAGATADAQTSSRSAQETIERERQARSALEDDLLALHTVSFTLAPGNTRGEADVHVVPREAANIRLELALERDPPSGSIRAIISSAAGETVWSGVVATPQRGSGATLRLNVPALVFTTEEYQLSLRGFGPDSSSEEIARYSIRVRRR